MKIRTVILIIASILLGACTGTPEPDEPAGLQISDPAKALEAAAGDEFKIVIESNPTTGYHWELMNEPEANVVILVSNEYKGDEPVMPGSGGVEVWTFKAVSAGETQITLGYYPPSNEPTDPQQTVTFTVKIR